jgi:hypothetical protein
MSDRVTFMIRLPKRSHLSKTVSLWLFAATAACVPPFAYSVLRDGNAPPLSGSACAVGRCQN